MHGVPLTPPPRPASFYPQYGRHRSTLSTTVPPLAAGLLLFHGVVGLLSPDNLGWLRCLGFGNRQNAIKSQKLMRARVMMQGITLGFLAWGTFMANMTKSEREENIRTGEIKRYNLAEAKD